MVKEKNGEPKYQKWLKTGVPGFDDLLEKGIPKGISVIVAGGPGTGKTIFCLQVLNYACTQGEKCLYVSFEEPEERLRGHMRDFGWDPGSLERKGLLVIKRMNPFKVSRIADALLEKEKGKLLIELKEGLSLVSPDFKPDRIFLDSVTALAAAFGGGRENYRIYIEQLFRYFEQLDATSFLITESTEAPKKLSPLGVEEFLADGVIIMHRIMHKNIRERAIEVLKLRGAKHQEIVVPFEIVSGRGIVVYPKQEIFVGLEKMEEKI